MQTFALCHSPLDLGLAHRLSEYLLLNLEVQIDLVPTSPWLDLIEAVETASTAGTVISLLSPNSVPERWPRDRWDAIRQPFAIWALAESCPYPPLLERRAFFDLRHNPLAAFRAIRCWHISRTPSQPPPPEFEPHFAAFIDRPGTATVDDPAVIRAATSYFESVYRIDTCCRTHASLTAELSRTFGLESSAGVSAQSALVEGRLNTERLLLILDGDQPPQPLITGRASVVRLPAKEHRAPPDPQSMTAPLAACQNGRAEPPTPAELDRCLAAAFATATWAVVSELGRSAYGYLKAEYRLVEAGYLLAHLKRAARANRDFPVQYECVREEAWIAERQVDSLAHPAETTQLTFLW